LADWLSIYAGDVTVPADELATQLPEANKPAIAALATRLETAVWEKASINQAIKDTMAEFGLKMPQVAIPVRLLVCGRAQTPSVDAVLALFDRSVVVQRLKKVA
jgi:glutamyl-tRNA synthetase